MPQNTPFRGLVLGNVRVRVRVRAMLVMWPPHECRVSDRVRVRVRVKVRVRASEGPGLAPALPVRDRPRVGLSSLPY